MALITHGKTFVNFGKNGRIKNYKIVEKLQNRKIKLPVYYVGEWDAEEKVWLGKLTNEKPNNGRKKSVKAK